MISFGIYQVLGNDLPPRHHPDQTLMNLDFTLKNEPPIGEAFRVFCLNRIVDQEKVAAYKTLMARYHCGWFEIPFDREYCKTLNLLEQGRYATNVNGARNQCIEHGLQRFETVAVLDGASFIKPDGWAQFVSMVDNYPGEGVYAMGVHRAESFDEVLRADFSPTLREGYKFGESTVWAMREPYLAFTKEADVRFDENCHYGKCDKGELLFRLGVPGVWERWEPVLLREAKKKMSKFAGSVKWAGYVIRLPSHLPSGDGDNWVRGAMRGQGVLELLKKIN